MDATPWTKEEFKKQLFNLEPRYHIHHPFHVAMHEGKLSRKQIQGWVANRFYYQITIPRKDAAILANCDDIMFRREWIKRISDHDGSVLAEGGIEAWLRLATACGLSREETMSLTHVVPGVRFAVDAYYQFAKENPYQDAVASCLTELFAPMIHQKRLDTWPVHYPWIEEKGLTYFQNRIKQANQDVEFALKFTLNYCDTKEKQLRALNILNFKCDILWSMLDAIASAYDFSGQMQLAKSNLKKYKLAPPFKLSWEKAQNAFVLLYPEGMVKLNESSSHILQLCDGTKNQEEIIQALESQFKDADIKQDVIDFLEHAHAKGWVNQQ